MTATIKGNNGAAYKRRQFQRLGVLIFVKVVIVVIVIVPIMYWINNNKNNTNNNKMASSLRRSIFRQRYNQQQHETMTNEQVLELILQGEIQLTNLMFPNRELLHKLLSQEQQNNQQQHSQQQQQKLMDYTGLFRATFCHVDWSWHEQDPSQTPMFRDVLSSSHCQSGSSMTHEMDLYQVVQATRLYNAKLQQEPKQHEQEPKQQQQPKPKQQEQQPKESVHIVDLAGFVFHESRCGSTLIANLLQWHNPKENIVYSESSPPIMVLSSMTSTMTAMSSSTSSSTTTSSTTTISPLIVQILQDVIYLMSRTNQFYKRRVFFKIQSIGTLYLSYFRTAFPTTPWIYVYRDPIEVIMSHFQGGAGGTSIDRIDSRRVNCIQSQRSSHSIPKHIEWVVHKIGTRRRNHHNTTRTRTTTTTSQKDDFILSPSQWMQANSPQWDPMQFSMEDYCAAHLASLTETAVENLVSSWTTTSSLTTSSSLSTTTNPNVHGIPINYKDLPTFFISWIVPHVWNITTNYESIQRMEHGSQSYSKSGSKNRRGNGGNTGGNGNTGGSANYGRHHHGHGKGHLLSLLQNNNNDNNNNDNNHFMNDSQLKQDHASNAIKQAAQRFLQPSYQILNQMAEQVKQQKQQ